MSNFWNNIFGTIGRKTAIATSKVDFIPTDYNGDATIPSNVMYIKGGEAVWLGLDTPEMQYWAYCFCSPLAAVIDREADCDINGKPMFLKDNKSGDESNSPAAQRMKTLISRPNPIQTWEEFRGQQLVFKKTYGYVPVYAMIPSGFDPSFTSFLWNLNPYFAKPVANKNFSLQKEENPILEWRISVCNKTYTLPSENIFVLKDGYINDSKNDLLLPLSKIAGLDFAISNICATMEADNVLLKKKGPLGFISHDPKPDNVAGYVPMTKDQKREIQGELDNYGLTWNQFQYVVTKLPVRWNPISFSVRDLMTKETARQAIDMVCDRFNYPAELMSGKNATYENRSAAEKYLYQNVIIPQNEKDMRNYNRFFKLDEYRVIMDCDFTDLPVLQEDVLKQSESDNNKASAYLILFQNSVITLNQYRTMMGIEVVANDDIYFEEYQKKYGAQVDNTMKAVPANKEKDKSKAA
jgi:hypothetical protein